MNPEYEAYCDLMRRVADVGYAGDLLQWDQEVYMPEGGGKFRARQLATLAGIRHEMGTSDELGSLLNQLKGDTALSDTAQKNIRESLRKYDEQKKYPNAFVVTMQDTVSRSFEAWQRARRANDFALFRPMLEKLVELKQEEAQLLGYEDHPYDALLNLYEPGATKKELDAMFGRIKSELVPYAKQLAGLPAPDTSFLARNYPRNHQWEFGLYLLERMHYDFTRGRQDISAHPFTTNFSPDDVRITTRIREDDFREMTWSTIHECGHALYEQGLPADMYGLPAGEFASLGIHESQSRLWENHVGRSRAFWTFHFPVLKEKFPENLGTVTSEEFFRAINAVRPSLIRTNADEVTYHLHILIRFEIECGLVNGQIRVGDLPAVWKEKYQAYLGLVVPDDAQGVLQDVHWSHGAFGYFPTYTLGSIYAAQFYTCAAEQTGGIESDMENGQTERLWHWLRAQIYAHGRTLSPGELCRQATGRTLDFSTFMKYIISKYGNVYGIS